MQAEAELDARLDVIKIQAAITANIDWGALLRRQVEAIRALLRVGKLASDPGVVALREELEATFARGQNN